MNPTLTLRDLVRTKTFEIQPACCSDSYFQRPFAMGGEAVESKRDKDEARGGGDGMAAQPPPRLVDGEHELKTCSPVPRLAGETARKIKTRQTRPVCLMKFLSFSFSCNCLSLPLVRINIYNLYSSPVPFSISFSLSVSVSLSLARSLSLSLDECIAHAALCLQPGSSESSTLASALGFHST